MKLTEMTANAGELFERHSSEVYRAALRITHNPEDAEEAVQETFVKAYEHPRELQDMAKLPAWLVRIASKEALTTIRRRKIRTGVPLDGHDAADRACDPEQPIFEKQLGELVRRMIDELPEAYRAVMLECAIQVRPVEQAASLLKLPAWAVRERLVRARILLRRKLVPCSRSCRGYGVHCLMRPCARFFERA